MLGSGNMMSSSSDEEHFSSSTNSAGSNGSDSESTPPRSGLGSGSGQESPSRLAGFLGWREQEDIVISGISGRFPESDNLAEFAENLYTGTDMVSVDDSRWEPGLYGNPLRSGKVRTWQKFDSQFFGIPPKQVNAMDPQVRNLLMATYEAVCDAGLSPQALRGSRTGVFVGSSGSETLPALTRDPHTVTGYSMSGCASSMFANRISFNFDLRGPSFNIDTACNSSLLALQVALTAMRDGQCDAAVVCGANATLTATNCLQFTRLGVLSPDGACKSFDADGKGYCKSEGLGVLLLQRSSEAFRNYATLIHAKSSTDGWKEEGVHFPSGASQGRLLREVYHESGVNPAHVSYMEAHGTGTKVGDPQEVNTIADIFCGEGRKGPLKMGSVKSNMGHAEPASGVASIAKVVLCCEKGAIPPNLHYQTPNPNIPSLTDGRIQVIDKETEWDGGYVGVNSFGFGGANTHVLLKSNNDEARLGAKEAPLDPALPKLFCYMGRTEAAVDRIFDAVEEHRDNHHFYSLLANQAQAPLSQHPHRGFLLMNKANGGTSLRQKARVGYERRPLWLVFTGMGAQWVGMGEDLMVLEPFRASILASSEVTRPLGCDPYSLLRSTTDKDIFKNVRNSIVCNIAIQVALTDLLKELGVKWEGMVGHSTGEIACAYADGALDRRQTMLLAYYRGETILQGGLPAGAMAAVGLSWEETEKRLAGTDVVPACHNAADSVSISGPADSVRKVVEGLEAEGIFARMVDSSGIPFHSPAMGSIKEALLERFRQIIPTPKRRSEAWESSSLKPGQAMEPWAVLSGPEYHVNNIVSSVRFHEAIQAVPEKAITVEVGGHALLAAILRRSVPAPATHIGLMSKKVTSNLDNVLEGLGKLYANGIVVHFERLYPAVRWPVPRGTPMIGSLIGWDESQEFLVCNGTGAGVGGAGGSVFSFDPYSTENDDDKFLLDHQIDGRPLFPFTGYPVMAWKALAKAEKREMEEMAVVFTELKVYRPTILNSAVKFSLSLAPDSGDFEVMEGDSIAASGNIRLQEEARPFFYAKLIEESFDVNELGDVVLQGEDLYKEFLLRGYEYGPKFRGIHRFANDGSRGLLKWDPEAPNWTTFLDALLQTSITGERGEFLRLPVRIRYLRVDPKAQAEAALKLGEGEEAVSVVRVRLDRKTNGMAAGGVEMRDLTVQTAQRRQNNAAQFTEQVLFFPYVEAECLKDHPTVRKAADLNGQAIAAALADGLGQWLKDFPGLAAQQPHGPHLAQAVADLRKAAPKAPEGLSPGPKSIAAALHEAFAMKAGPDEAKLSADNVLQLAKAKVAEVVADSAHLDPYWGAWAFQRAVKSCLDLVVENARTHALRMLMVEPREPALSKTLTHMMTAHPQVDVDTVLSYAAKPQVEGEEAETFEILETDWAAGGKALEVEEAFHVTVLDRVLSKVRDVPRYLLALKQSLNEEGFLLINEVTSNFERAAALEILQGTTGDFAFDGARRFGMYHSDEEWLALFREAGYVLVASKRDPSMDSSLYMLRPLPETPLEPELVDCDDVEEFSWVGALQAGLDRLQGEPLRKTIMATSTKTTDNGLVGLIHCFREEYLSRNRVRGLFNISLDPATPPLDVESPEVQERLKTMDLHIQCYRDGQWGTIRSYLVSKDDGGRVSTPHAFMNNLVHGDLGSFQWVQSPNNFYPFLKDKTEDSGLISIYYSSLNFRDVMLATGRLSADAIPGDFALRECLLGSEFSGRIGDGAEKGKRIMGMVPAQSLATDVMVNRHMCFDVPDSWSLEDAATVPVVYLTAYYSLCLRGGLKASDSVLVHSGSGGVGQAAIAIALAMGCEVFTTVSTAEKRAFLQGRFPQLQDRHFANSRSTEFEYHIAAETGGRGVDVVLNSLSEDKLMASVRCLAEFGRFLEIGKFDLANNTALGMEIFLKNIQFHGILLDGLTENKDWDGLANMLYDGIKEGTVKPLPRSTFPHERVEDAFRFMAQGKHIGKVLIKVRDEEAAKLCEPSRIEVSALRRAYCHPDQAYLLTGGLGGFGLQVANWLVSRGARHLVLTSRSGAKSGYQRRCIKAWEDKGVSVSVSKLDVGDEAQCRQLIRDSSAAQPLGGIFHLAMVLRDAMFENQTPQNFKEAAAAKLNGTRFLDRATRELCGEELRWFVCFSSVTSGRGNQGQTNYGWANSTMERICEQRHRDGLAGQAIQWGAIGDVGVILNNMGDNNTVVGGTLPQRMPSCLLTLDEFMGWDNPIVSCFVRADTGKSSGGGGGGDILETIARIIGVELSTIDEDAPLSDLGLDSLMGMEIKQAVERDANVVLSMKEVTSLTMKKLKALVKSGGGAGDSKSEAPVDLRQQLLEIFRLRVDANNCLTHEGLAPLNDKTEGTPVFFVHTMEGIAEPLKELGAAMEVPAFCLQCTPDTPVDSIEAMAKHYTAVMRKAQPSGPYNVVGYSYGACIAFEMGVGLEAAGEKPTVLLLDSSHHYMKTYRTIYRAVYKVREGESLVGHPNFETELITAIAIRFAAVDYNGLRTALLGEADWAGRLRLASEQVMADGLIKSADTFHWICNSVRARYVAADAYAPSAKLAGPLTLVRAEVGIAKEADLGDDYGLRDVVDGPLDVVVMPGDHEGIAIANAQATANVIHQKIGHSLPTPPSDPQPAS